MHTLRGHGGSVRCVAFDHGGGRLATASVDRSVRVWDLSRNECADIFRAPLGTTALAFEPEGDHLYALGVRELCSWNLRMDGARATLRPHAAGSDSNPHPYIYTVDFSPDGREVVTGSWDGTLQFTPRDGSAPREVALDGRRVFATRWTPDGKHLVIAGAPVDASEGEGLIAILDKAGRTVVRFNPPRFAYSRLAISPNGRFAIAAGCRGTVVRFSIPEGRVEATWTRPRSEPYHLNPPVCIGNDRVYVGTSVGKLRTFDRKLRLLSETDVSDRELTALAAQPGTRRVACGDISGVIRIVRPQDGKVLRAIARPHGRRLRARVPSRRSAARVRFGRRHDSPLGSRERGEAGHPQGAQVVRIRPRLDPRRRNARVGRRRQHAPPLVHPPRPLTTTRTTPRVNPRREP